MARTGRPPIAADKRRDALINVRVTGDELALITTSALADKMSVSEWVRARAVAAAKRAQKRLGKDQA